MVETDQPWPSTPADALRLLLEGNQRFVDGERLHPHQDADHRTALAPGQRPFAVLFGCSDSRLAAEIIFDRGLGDLFVVRTAGHVVGPEVLGSIEYGVAILDAPLVAVLGHDSCGAIAATLDALRDGKTPGGFIRDVVERVMLSVVTVHEEAMADSEAAVEEHVRYTVEMLTQRSTVIAERLAQGRVGVIGLSYRLAEGSVRRVAGHGV
ncbi:carbonic anhydrase [Longispora fulva]|uniref:carbonic anhydrase n=1 Tax=Longispora fulva TaxID=619741 RepID=A0A8J7GFC1_9ACTN|nr:carbonic anhydrase [Longispora fulva]MBG6135502.1 carbonic anhydrase [Longispora fulva]GIG56258.1 carbonic anhydrase [Longispora fulva]